MYFRTKAMANMAPETVAVNPAKSLINSTMKTSQWGWVRPLGGLQKPAPPINISGETLPIGPIGSVRKPSVQ